ncbi:hypothetical protein [Brevundimonas sp.]|uniref:hypothetical protein n=1 Tax=Brevundimonas sp. TaxID=1871086 RepID=UPI002737D084|nr:hypothetical protein [Brevundimonas sp.]MDP3801407.1 hypothetical protein [Brevundimonas sp.]
MRIIDVRPLADGWTVRSDQIENDLVFLSGRAAECAAMELANRLAKAGTPCEIHIHLRDGSLGGRFLSPALISPEKGAEPRLRDPAIVLEAA